MSFIQRNYGIPKSTLYYFINKYYKGSINKLQSWFANKNKLNNQEKLWIVNNVQPPKPPLTICKLNWKMSQFFEKKDRRREIKCFLKDELNYTYKKGSATTISGASQYTKLLQSIFSSRILWKLYDNNLLINIDEASF